MRSFKIEHYENKNRNFSSMAILEIMPDKIVPISIFNTVGIGAEYMQNFVFKKINSYMLLRRQDPLSEEEKFYLTIQYNL